MNGSADVGQFVWRDLMSNNPAVSEAFFTSLFGWNVKTRSGAWGDYRTLMHDGVAFAGIRQLPIDGNYPSHWISYLRVGDVDSVVARATDMGAAIGLEPVDAPEVGRMAGIFDPQGAWFALLSPATAYPLPEQAKIPGYVGWNELVTSDPEAASAFYHRLFDWEINPVNIGIDYRIVTAGGMQHAGIMNVPADGQVIDHDGMAPAWVIYFRTHDIDQSLETVMHLGGQVLTSIHDVPDVGRTAWASDSTGTLFALIQPARV